jgi:hypothetical protein
LALAARRSNHSAISHPHISLAHYFVPVSVFVH